MNLKQIINLKFNIMKTAKILEAINSMSNDQLVELNNRYSQVFNTGFEVYDNDEEFFTMFFPNPGDGYIVAQKIFYGDYNFSHNYVIFNGYENLESFDYFEVKDLCEFPETMAKYIKEEFEEFEDLF